MSETLYVPIALITAGVTAWISAGLIAITDPSSTMPAELLKAGTGAMGLSAAAYQAQIVNSKSSTRRATRKKPAQPKDKTP